MLAGYVLALLNEHVRKIGLKAIPLSFVHDAGDWEVEIEHLMRFIPCMRRIMVDFIRNSFGVPVDIDYAIGLDQNFMLHLSRKESDPEDQYHFQCVESVFRKIIERLQSFFTVEYSVTEMDYEYRPLSDMFSDRGSFSMYFGEKIPRVNGTLTLQERI